MKHLFLALILLGSALTCVAETREPVGFWTDIVSQSSLAEIAATMDNPGNPSWPSIGSAYEIRARAVSSGMGADTSLKLADAMRAALARSLDRNTNFDLEGLTANVGMYSRMAHEFGRAGGYSNWVLRDSVRRIIVFHLSKWLIDNPTQAGAATPLLKKCSPEKLELRAALFELSSADQFMSKKRDQLEKIDEGKNIYEALEPIGIGMQEIMAASKPEELRTTALLEDPSALRLVWRMANTDALFTVNLLGLLKFFENGGESSELNPADIRPFEARMKGSARSFQYPLLNIRKVTEVQLLNLLRLHGNTDEQDRFMEVALN